MYFGNTSALLEFDSKTWHNYNMPKSTPVRSLDVNPEGTVFVGSFNTFGYMATDAKGKSIYVPLNQLIKEKEYKNFGDVWRLVAVSSGVYFFTPKLIFCYKNNEITVIPAAMEAMFGFKAYDRVFVMLKNKGLCVLDGKDLILLPHTEIFTPEHRMYTCIEF
jgi:hypothetical protein